VEEAHKDISNSVAVGVVDAEGEEGEEGEEDGEGGVEFQRKIAQQAPAAMILTTMPILCAFYPPLPAVESTPSTKGFTLPMVPRLHPLAPLIPSTSTACTHA